MAIFRTGTNALALHRVNITGSQSASLRIANWWSFSICAWIKPFDLTATGLTSHWLGRGDADGSYCISIRGAYENHKAKLYNRDSGGTYSGPELDLVVGRWIHMAITCARPALTSQGGMLVSAYFNGHLWDSEACDKTPTYTTPNFGANFWGSSICGSAAAVKGWDRGLTQAEIVQEMLSVGPVNIDGLILNAPCEGGPSRAFSKGAYGHSIDRAGYGDMYCLTGEGNIGSEADPPIAHGGPVLIPTIALAGITTEVLADEYSSDNYNLAETLCSSLCRWGYGQETQPGAGVLTRAQFWMYKTGSPPGNAVAKLYASDEASPAKPTGVALATSDSRSASSFGISWAWEEFVFTDEYSMTAGTDYFIVVEYSGGDVDNRLNIGADNSSPTHSGNAAHNQAGSWVALSGIDTCFRIYRNAPISFDASDYLENAVLNHTIDGATMAQPSGVYSYARTQASSWAAASGGSKSTSGAVAFTGLPATSITGYAIWDAVSGGNCLYTGPQVTAITVASGDELEFASGDITVTLD
jgi:hypothetical protein